MRRLLLNPTMIGAAIGAISNVRQTIKGPRDWRVYAVWGAWALTTAVAIVTIRHEIEAEELGIDVD